MWRVQVNRAIREIRFVMKDAPEHHGAWRFILTKLPHLQAINQQTFFSIHQIANNFETPSACHLVYGDKNGTVDEIETAGLTAEGFEEIIKEKVKFGLTLPRQVFNNNEDRELPVDVVESGSYVHHMHDGF